MPTNVETAAVGALDCLHTLCDQLRCDVDNWKTELLGPRPAPPAQMARSIRVIRGNTPAPRIDIVEMLHALAQRMDLLCSGLQTTP